ncbi:OmpA family protein [Sneathiella litorea]|uniref:OmpA family protein n=1 Tax=Sneathiella litorea TaxID=2606216 RepID=A0A6L8WAT0_9PROT|nr:OmpA family protein [Sneathiella litorea]MZR32168.1 OmpA family protein [Sneathiella litorea]
MTRLTAATYSVSLLASLLISVPASSLVAGNVWAQTDKSTRPAVEVNLEALKYSNPLLNAPTRIVDGNSVIILTPPSLRKKAAVTLPQKVVKPLVKPALTLSEPIAVAVAPVPLPTVNPAKRPEVTEETKFEDVAIPVVKMDTAPIPTPEVSRDLTEDVAEKAAEKVTEKTDLPLKSVVSEPSQAAPASPEVEMAPETVMNDEKIVAEKEIKVAAVAPDAGLPASKSVTDTNDHLTRILFAEGAADLPSEAQTTLQAIADQIKDGSRLNVQLLAYGQGNNVSAARRISLGRALAVRSKLMELGVNNKQIEVRALGAPEGGGPSDRVDLLLITR